MEYMFCFDVFSAHLMEYFDPSFMKYLTSNYVGCNLFYLLQELDDRLILIHDKKVSLHAVAKVVELALKKQKPLLIHPVTGFMNYAIKGDQVTFTRIEASSSFIS